MKKSNYLNILFIICFSVILVLGFISMVREPKGFSIKENRKFNVFTIPTIRGFVSGKYQEELENALNDQLVASEAIKEVMNNMFTIVNYAKIPDFLAKNKYVNITQNIAVYNGSYALVNNHLEYNLEKRKSNVEYNTNIINDINNNEIEMYVYYVNNSVNMNFETGIDHIDIEKYLRENLKGEYEFASLEVNTYEDYLKFFYNTDHHWNHIASYKAYTDIAKMMGVENTLEVIEERDFNSNFYGSFAKSANVYDITESFTSYIFEYPEMTVKINGEIAEDYGEQGEYLKGKVFSEFESHYAEFYGPRLAELVLDTNYDEKQNVLILGNSFTDSIAKNIASHFNKTHIISYVDDFENVFGYEFNYDEYIEQNNIDKVLILAEADYMSKIKLEMRGN